MEHLPANSTHANVMLYILVETAQANQLNVYEYFELLLTEIPKHMNDTSLTFFLGHLLFRKPVQADLRNLNFSMYKKYIKISLHPAGMQGFAL